MSHHWELEFANNLRCIVEKNLSTHAHVRLRLFTSLSYTFVFPFPYAGKRADKAISLPKNHLDEWRQVCTLFLAHLFDRHSVEIFPTSMLHKSAVFFPHIFLNQSVRSTSTDVICWNSNSNRCTLIHLHTISCRTWDVQKASSERCEHDHTKLELRMESPLLFSVSPFSLSQFCFLRYNSSRIMSNTFRWAHRFFQVFSY